MPPQPIQVGVYRLTDPTVLREQYEVAAWYKDIEVPPGDYPLLATWDDLRPDVVKALIVTNLHGIVVDEYFPALFAGVPVGGPYQPEHIGQPATKSPLRFPDWSVGQLLHDGDPRFVLDQPSMLAVTHSEMLSVQLVDHPRPVCKHCEEAIHRDDNAQWRHLTVEQDLACRTQPQPPGRLAPDSAWPREDTTPRYVPTVRPHYTLRRAGTSDSWHHVYRVRRWMVTSPVEYRTLRDALGAVLAAGGSTNPRDAVQLWQGTIYDPDRYPDRQPAWSRLTEANADPIMTELHRQDLIAKLSGRPSPAHDRRPFLNVNLTTMEVEIDP